MVRNVIAHVEAECRVVKVQEVISRVVGVRHFASLVVIVVVICHSKENYNPRDDKERKEAHRVKPKKDTNQRHYYHHRYQKASRWSRGGRAKKPEYALTMSENRK